MKSQGLLDRQNIMKPASVAYVVSIIRSNGPSMRISLHGETVSFNKKDKEPILTPDEPNFS